jgi:hypothetical protein
MVGRVGFEPTTIGLKVQNGEIYRIIYQCVTGTFDAYICSTMHNRAGLIHAKLTRECGAQHNEGGRALSRHGLRALYSNQTAADK